MLDAWLSELGPLVPGLLTSTLVVLGLVLARRLLDRAASEAEHSFRNELAMLVLTALGVLVVLLVLPVSDATRSQLLNLAGIVLSAGIALASTTFIGNAMAALMLRAVRNFRTGDFVRVGEHFGRVTERGLFHTEIQTEDRDLTTLPNLYLVTNPVKVIRASGTIVGASVSLGYDVDHVVVEGFLREAVLAAGLRDPFVHVTSLGDFSVTYRFAGFLEDVKQILTARSRLNTCAVDALHAGGVEIVSPTFMNTRAFRPGDRFVTPGRTESRDDAGALAEDLAFDKAERVTALEKLRQVHAAASAKLAELEDRLARTPREERAGLERSRDALAQRLERLATTIDDWADPD